MEPVRGIGLRGHYSSSTRPTGVDTPEAVQYNRRRNPNRMLELFRDAYRYRELIWVLTLKELKIRYKGSVLGYFWTLLNPLLMTAVYVIVFTAFARVGRFGIENYPLFLMCAMFPWTFYQQAVTYSVESIVGNGPLLKKVYIPKMVFPLAAVLANGIHLLLSLIPLAFFFLVFKTPLPLTWLYLPVPLLALVLFTAGCGFLVAAANVFFRDTEQIVQVFLRAYFFFCPVIYDLEHISPKFHSLLVWNPLLYILEGFRAVLLYGTPPSPRETALALAVGALATAIGYAFFRRVQDSFPLHV